MQFHVDPINILVAFATFIGVWWKFFRQNAIGAQTIDLLVKWTEQHGKDCGDHRKQLNDVLTQLQVTNAKLVEIVASHSGRLERLERQMDVEIIKKK